MVRHAHHFRTLESALLHALRWGFVVSALLLATILFAQPQAPVVWGEARWLGYPHAFQPPFDSTLVSCNAPVLMGDTLVLAFSTAYGAYTGLSLDNGLTHGPWQLVIPNPAGGGNFAIYGSGGNVICLRNNFLGDAISWMKRTTDLGASWGPQQDVHSGRFYPEGLVSGTSMFRVFRVDCTSYELDRFSRSFDGGVTWSQEITLDTAALPVYGLWRTHNRVLMAACPLFPGSGYRVSIAIGENLGETWTPLTPIPNQSLDSIYWQTGGFSIAADTSSETVMFVTRAADNRIWLHSSADGANSWDSRLLMNDTTKQGGCSRPEVFCQGRLWALCWARQWPGAERDSVWWRFSADGGRAWYPEQAVMRALDDHAVRYFCGQFVRNEVRIYGGVPIESQIISNDYCTATGIMIPDAIEPTLSTALSLPDEIGGGSEVDFFASAFDNDSLPFVQVILRRNGSPDSIVVPLAERVSPTGYSAPWQVPNDTALWHYYYRAEDMWENVSVFPDTGVFSFHTTGWSAARDFSVHPSSFIVQVFPNPFNSTVRITFSLPHSDDVRVNVFNVSGRLVRTLVDQRIDAGQHFADFDGAALASGIYFVCLKAGATTHTQKIMLLK
jgi:hypothetical protein